MRMNIFKGFFKKPKDFLWGEIKARDKQEIRANLLIYLALFNLILFVGAIAAMYLRKDSLAGIYLVLLVPLGFIAIKLPGEKLSHVYKQKGFWIEFIRSSYFLLVGLILGALF